MVQKQEAVTTRMELIWIKKSIQRSLEFQVSSIGNLYSHVWRTRSDSPSFSLSVLPSPFTEDDKAKDEAKAKEEKAALDELLQQYGKDALRDTFWKFAKFDSPDTTILRFLRARKVSDYLVGRSGEARVDSASSFGRHE